MTSAAADQPTAAPIVVLGSGQRCGSTLLQRLLMSHPQVLIWGEHRGQLRGLFRMLGELHRWDGLVGETARAELAELGNRGFLANLLPGPACVDDAGRAFVDALFARPAAAAGRPRWGFKEVRYGRPACERLHRLYPAARFVHVTRDPRDVLRSLHWWEHAPGPWGRRDTWIAMRFWQQINASFLGPQGDGPPVLHLRYEDLVADPEGHTRKLADWCGLDAEVLDPRVFDTRAHTVGPRGRTDRSLTPFPELPDKLRWIIAAPEFARVAAAWGYPL